MLWQTEPSYPPVSVDEKASRPAELKTPEPDDYDRLLDSQMVSEGCPNYREDD